MNLILGSVVPLAMFLCLFHLCLSGIRVGLTFLMNSVESRQLIWRLWSFSFLLWSGTLAGGWVAPCPPVASLLVHLPHSLSAKCPPHHDPASQPAHLLLLLVNIAHQLPIHLVYLALNSSVLTLCQLIITFLSTLHNCCTQFLFQNRPREITFRKWWTSPRRVICWPWSPH